MNKLSRRNLLAGLAMAGVASFGDSVTAMAHKLPVCLQAQRHRIANQYYLPSLGKPQRKSC